jgi:hypothetical protein
MPNICADKASRLLFTKPERKYKQHLHSFQRCENCCMVNLNRPEKKKLRKPYEKPTVTKLTPEEAKFKLIDLASRGSQGAKDLLEMIFADEAKKLSTG